MDPVVDKLSSFLGGIKSATFRDRIMPWRWRTIVRAAYEADSECQQFVDSLGQRTSDLEDARAAVTILQGENEQSALDNASLKEELSALRQELEQEKASTLKLRETVSSLNETIRQDKETLTAKQNEIAALHEKLERLSKEIAASKESEARNAQECEEKVKPLVLQQYKCG
jgi:predicted RNase H-like nuclease (RuvC/YqgF family)